MQREKGEKPQTKTRIQLYKDCIPTSETRGHVDVIPISAGCYDSVFSLGGGIELNFERMLSQLVSPEWLMEEKMQEHHA